MMNKKISDLLSIKSKIKFEQNDDIPYRGIPDDTLRLELSRLIDNSIDQFVLEIEGNGTAVDFLKIIQNGVNQFDRFYLDTDDRERVCLYYEEIMDVLNLESSEGILNKWMYGFEF